MATADPLTDEEILSRELEELGLKGMEREYKFHPARGWRFDRAFPQHKLGIELHGYGRHGLPGGMRNDCEKMNAATELGWRVLVYPSSTVRNRKRLRRVLLQIIRVIEGRKSIAGSARVLKGE